MTDIFITWTEEVQEFDRWVADKYGDSERMFKNKTVTKKARWMSDVPANEIDTAVASAHGYISDQIADGDSRNLKVVVR